MGKIVMKEGFVVVVIVLLSKLFVASAGTLYIITKEWRGITNFLLLGRGA